MYHEADGIITPTTEAFDPPESIAAMRKFLGLTGRKLYMLGPLQPAISGENSVSNELSQSSQGQEIATFLERILKSHGPKSLIYVRIRTSSYRRPRLTALSDVLWVHVLDPRFFEDLGVRGNDDREEHPIRTPRRLF